ncbi:hypothetical protein SELMODRAFT_408224 [Selaginella moellendorffii]|uniref:Uncharacterized protein n=1 Tax=Selaginella moellendorffii TaxID=88036 RepID=D8R7L2_SELML|nr:hypothetical protein SELMODRAFT_408224 [Selaginella moellendorffii]
MNDVAQIFFGRVVKNQGPRVMLTDEWKKVIGIAGSNPRMLSFLINSLVTELPRSISLHELNRELQEGLDKRKVRSMLDNAWTLFSSQYLRTDYNKGKTRLILQAIYTSQLGVPVTRGEKVWDGSDDTWGDLEGQGIVGLIQAERDRPLRKARKVSGAVTPNLLQFRVRFLPLRIKGSMAALDFINKEDADVLEFAFMIRLKTLLNNGAPFTLGDIVPHHTWLSDDLHHMQLQLPSPPSKFDFGVGLYLAYQIRDPADSIQSLIYRLKKNSYTDTIMKLERRIFRWRQKSFSCTWKGSTGARALSLIGGLVRKEVIHIHWTDDVAELPENMPRIPKQIVIGGWNEIHERSLHFGGTVTRIKWAVK